MESIENKKVTYHFGRFVLDPSEKVLFVDGEPRRLPAKEFDTLLLLVEHNGKAMSKEEMMEVLWQGAFVEEGNLAKQISRLRKIFDGESEGFIETIPKHGYRFSADVTSVDKVTSDTGGLVLQKKTIKQVNVKIDSEEDDPAAPDRLIGPAKTPFFTLPRTAVIALFLSIGIFAIWFVAKARSASTTVNKIAVLPLKQLNGDEDGKALAAGLTDALITRIGRLKPLIVRPASSVKDYTDAADPVEIGAKLDVDAVLEGSLQQIGRQVRIHLRLLDTHSGELLWSDSFDGQFNDLLGLEERISDMTARHLVVKLSNGVDQYRAKNITANEQAHEAYIKGLYFLNKRSEDGFRKAIEYFDSATAADPNYAPAYVGVANSYILLGVWGAGPPSELFPQARQAAKKALAIDADLPEALVPLAFVEWVHDWDTKSADAAFRRATELDPNNATAHHWYSYFLVSLGRSDEALAEIAKAREIEGPLTLSVNTDIGEVHSWAGNYDQAEHYLRDVLKIEPKFAIAHHVLAINLIKQGRIAEAIAEEETARELEPEPRVLSVLGYAYALNGDTEKAKQMIGELEEMAKKKYVSPFSMAVVYFGLGEKDTAFAELEKAYAERSDSMAILKVYPLLEPYRSDRRFTDLLTRIGYASSAAGQK